jgi:hypothetical protein
VLDAHACRLREVAVVRIQHDSLQERDFLKLRTPNEVEEAEAAGSAPAEPKKSCSAKP